MRIFDVLFYVLFAGLLGIGLGIYYGVVPISLPESRVIVMIFAGVAGIIAHTIVVFCNYLSRR